MRKVNEADFESYTIVKGWSLTVYDFKKAMYEWKGINAGTLYGNKHDGSRCILDQK